MENIDKIINILKLEVAQYNSTKEELEQLKGLADLYNEVFIHAKNIDELVENKDVVIILLDKIDRNISLTLSKKIAQLDIVKKKKMIDTKEYKNIIICIREIFDKLSIKFQELNLKINNDEKEIENCNEQVKIFKTVLSRIKYSQYISYEFVIYLDDFLQKRGYSEIEEIKFLEIIDIYNQNVYERINKIPHSYKNEILDMLSFGFEQIDEENTDYNPEIAKKIDIHYLQLEYQTDIEQYFDEIKHEITNQNDLKLFYILMLKKIQDKLLEIISLIKDKEFYADLTIREEIVEKYRYLVELYMKFREEKFKIDIKDEELIDTGEVNLIFAHNSSNKPYFLKDLKTVNNEYLAKMYELIISLKNGTLANKYFDGFSDKYKRFGKLKYDQIRIVFHQINPKLYCLMGVGVKKDNSGTLLYNVLCNRNYPKTKDEISNLLNESDEILSYIEQYVNENKRRGNR